MVSYGGKLGMILPVVDGKTVARLHQIRCHATPHVAQTDEPHILTLKNISPSHYSIRTIDFANRITNESLTACTIDRNNSNRMQSTCVRDQYAIGSKHMDHR